MMVGFLRSQDLIDERFCSVKRFQRLCFVRLQAINDGQF